MQTNRNNIRVSVFPEVVRADMKVTQNDRDTNEVFVRVFDQSGVEINYSQITSALIIFTKPDYHVVQGDMTVQADHLYYKMGTNEITCTGEVKAQIQLVGPSEERLTIGGFSFTVQPDPVTPWTVQSTSEYSFLEQFVQRVDEALQQVGPIEELVQDAHAVAGALESNISTGNALHNILLNDIQEAANIKESLDASSAIANSSKSALDSSITNAGTVKAGLDNSISNASNATDVLNSLVSNISVGSSLNTNLQTSIQTAQNRKNDLDNIITIANTTKTGLDASVAAALDIKDELDDILAGADIGQLASDIDDLQEEVSTINTSLTAINNELASKETPSGAQAKVNAAITAHEQASNPHNQYALGADLASLQSDVTSHKAEKANLSVLGHVNHAVLTTTLNTTWSGTSAPYTKTVSVSGILATDRPIIDVVMSGTYSIDEARIEAWGYIYRAVTANGSITFYATEKPTVALPIQIKVVR